MPKIHIKSLLYVTWIMHKNDLYIINQSLLAMKAHADGRRERDKHCQDSLSITYTWARLLGESCILLSCPRHPLSQKFRAGHAVDVYIGNHCSSNVSSKVNGRSGQLCVRPEGFHNGWLEPCESNLLWLLYG